MQNGAKLARKPTLRFGEVPPRPFALLTQFIVGKRLASIILKASLTESSGSRENLEVLGVKLFGFGKEASRGSRFG